MHQLPFGRNLCDQEDASACTWVYVGGRANQRSELVNAPKSEDVGKEA